ncbi:(2Fe-2S) ferredoxin domain-containing protein [Chroococcidiopsis sp. TS-821]|uniref:(2Fe-2S) ferredoxin domain-containing protein n=1 Tax=Chroococcidiopsis sp. TS-821 TaxID=1378066 RepID=UPI000CEDAC65|nr:(2Fe-2S) ferredoxin domain-containing protein [Chroococcidiopsis sp. TS-821]PPS44843.1 NADH dehydrogenase [Chroococcidiopsis sp. TS-821]
MSDGQRDLRSPFRLEGKFSGFITDGYGIPKYLQLEIATGNLTIKLAKRSRLQLGLSLQPNDWIEVFGEKKLKYKTGELRWKADCVNKLTASNSHNVENKIKIVACYKSGCLKKGGSKLLSDLERTLHERGLSDRVVIQTTGCLKRCSQAPNLLLKPGNVRLNGMTPDAIAVMLLDKMRTTITYVGGSNG